MKSIISPKTLFRGISSLFNRDLADVKSDELPLVSLQEPQEEPIQEEPKTSSEDLELQRILEECKAADCSSLTEAKDGCRAYVDIFAKWRNGKRCPRAFHLTGWASEKRNTHKRGVSRVKKAAK